MERFYHATVKKNERASVRLRGSLKPPNLPPSNGLYVATIVVSGALIRIKPPVHFFAGSEERDCLLPHRHNGPRSGIVTHSPVSNFDGKNAEAAQLNAITLGHRVGDLIENGTDDLLNLVLGRRPFPQKLRILAIFSTVRNW
jgi:hypothetical protein